MKTFNFNDTEVSLKRNSYRNNGTLAMEMITVPDDEPYSMITVNICCPLQNDKFAFVDENNNPGIGAWLRKNGIAKPLGYKQRSGFCLYELYEFNLAAL